MRIIEVEIHPWGPETSVEEAVELPEAHLVIGVYSNEQSSRAWLIVKHDCVEFAPYWFRYIRSRENYDDRGSMSYVGTIRWAAAGWVHVFSNPGRKSPKDEPLKLHDSLRPIPEEV